MTKALRSAFHLAAAAIFFGVMASHVQGQPAKPAKQQAVATKQSQAWKPAKALGLTRAEIQKITTKVPVRDAGKNRISIDTSAKGGKAVWYMDLNPVNGRVQTVTLKYPKELEQKDIDAFIKSQVPDADLNHVDAMAVPAYVNPYAPLYDTVEAYMVGSKSHKTWYLEKGAIEDGDHYILLTDLPTATKVALDGDPTSRMVRQLQFDKANGKKSE